MTDAAPTRRDRPSLSVAIVCKDNEATIGRTLDSVRGLADVVLAVDSGSTDGTLDLLAGADARVVHQAWLGHVRQKQRALELCDTDWVLCLDSDESVEPALRASIERALAADDPAIDAYEVNRKVWYAGRALEHAWQPEWRLRLVRRGRAAWGGYDPHDELRTTDPGARTARLPGDLRHDSISTISAFLAKQGRARRHRRRQPGARRAARQRGPPRLLARRRLRQADRPARRVARRLAGLGRGLRLRRRRRHEARRPPRGHPRAARRFRGRRGRRAVTGTDVIWALALPGAYALGSVPFGLLVGFARGVDVREHGSGNIGATNVLRTVGKPWGYLAFALDALKGAAPVLIAGRLTGALGEADPAATTSLLWLGVAMAAILGHMFPVFLRFKGGKGVATGFGALLALWPHVTLGAAAALVVWLLALRVTRYVSVASCAAAIALPLSIVAGRLAGWPAPGLEGAGPFLGVTALLAAFVVWKHRGNLARVRAGTEPKVGRKRPDAR